MLMSFARVYSAQPSLLSAHIISVEADLSQGLNAFSIVGLPDKAVEEARDRMSAALKNAGYTSPKQTNQKTIVALAPADLKKEGPLFDVAIALSYLLARGDIAFDPDGRIFLGELSLDGILRSVGGVLPIAREAKRAGFRELYVPLQNVKEAALIEGIAVFGVATLEELISHLNEKRSQTANKTKKKLASAPQTKIDYANTSDVLDVSLIKGQVQAKRGLEIAAAGAHNIVMWGPPGTGKTLLAKAFAGLLPPLSFEEALEVTSIHSVAGTLPTTASIITTPPFRAPHHTASHVAIVGGGAIPKPGEITLSHRGVLFLDEFPEFDRRVLETLRQPLEDRVISISRVRGGAQFPANLILVATMNPCPCGNFGNEKKACVCSPQHIIRYQRKISGPIMDRIDLWIEVPHVDYALFDKTEPEGETSAEVRARIEQARKRQRERFEISKISSQTNSMISAKDMDKVFPLSADVRKTLREYAERLSLSPRVYHKTIKLARTIADLEGSDDIKMKHLLEALQYRPKAQAL